MAVDYQWINAQGTPNLLVSDTAEALVTVGANETVFVTEISIFNAHSRDVTLTVYRVPNNAGSVGTPGDATNRQYVETITTLDNIQLKPQWTLDQEGDTIQMKGSVADKLIVTISGAVQT